MRHSRLGRLPHLTGRRRDVQGEGERASSFSTPSLPPFGKDLSSLSLSALKGEVEPDSNLE